MDTRDYATLDLLSGNTDDLSARSYPPKSRNRPEFYGAVRNKAVEAYKEIMNMQVEPGNGAWQWVFGTMPGR